MSTIACMCCLWEVNTANTHTGARTHARTHTHTHTRVHTHTHTHTHKSIYVIENDISENENDL